MAADAVFILNPIGLAQLKYSPNEGLYKDLLARALRVEKRAKQLAPVRTGRLRASIRFHIEPSRYGLTAVIGSDVDYALAVHEGTRYTRPRPFLRSALEAAGGVA